MSPGEGERNREGIAIGVAFWPMGPVDDVYLWGN
jgi:hypothetical protein